MISLADYFGIYANHSDANFGVWNAADVMLDKVNALLRHCDRMQVKSQINPKTGTQISGEGNGGFRPKDCPVGAKNSAHKQGRAVDVYDPDGKLDELIDDKLLEQYGLYREAPVATPTWVHLQDRPPGSGKRTFQP